MLRKKILTLKNIFFHIQQNMQFKSLKNKFITFYLVFLVQTISEIIVKLFRINDFLLEQNDDDETFARH